MCCIFTCCGWMIDLVQRAWVFAMSCCISSAVCCALITASMSGVALGYNYSLAEYIDLKETNVSVFLKRGVFDDEVVDEMDWRRGGGGMAAAQRRMDEEPTSPASVPDFPFKYRRADDEGIFATTQPDIPNTVYSDRPERNQFEGSLMKLTAVPRHEGLNQAPAVDSQMAKVISGYPQDSMEQLKAIQGLINRRRMEGASLGSDENRGFMMPKPILYGMDSTGSVPMDGSSSSPWGISNEMNVIQRLLNARKEAARRFESSKRTLKTTRRPPLTGVYPEVFPDIMGGARRMGASRPTQGFNNDADVQQEQLQRAVDPEDVNAPSKWYHPKPPMRTTESIYFDKPARGPVTLSHLATSRKIKSKDELLLSQESYRRAMEEHSKEKVGGEKDGTTELPQKDYDEEEVKGFPNRKRRQKRNRRNIPVTIQTDKENATNNPVIENILPYRNGKSLFSKLMTGLMRFKLLFAPVDEAVEVSHERRSTESLPKTSSKIFELDIHTIRSSYANIGASITTGIGTLKLVDKIIAVS